MSGINSIQEPSSDDTKPNIDNGADSTGIDSDQSYISSQIEFISDEEGALQIDEHSPISFIASLWVPFWE